MSQPYPGSQPRKGLPVWAWVLISIFGVIFVCIALAVGTGLYVAHKIAENPQKFVDKIVSANPNIEVVSRDEDGRMTLRDRRNGKTVTISFDELRRGGIHVMDGAKEVSIGGSGIEVRDGDKKVHVGAQASAHVPAWIPPYPGSSTKASIEEGDGGTVAFTTSDSDSQVAKYYADTLKSQGYDVSREGDVVTARNSSTNREITVRRDHDNFKIEYRSPKQ